MHITTKRDRKQVCLIWRHIPRRQMPMPKSTLAPAATIIAVVPRPSRITWAKSNSSSEWRSRSLLLRI